MRHITVTEAMERYDRSRAGVLAILMMFRDINGKGAAPITKGKLDGGRCKTQGFMLSPALDLELRRRK